MEVEAEGQANSEAEGPKAQNRGLKIGWRKENPACRPGSVKI
jgi:hypothetical protein